MANNEVGNNQFDGFQINPHTLGDNWAFTGDEGHGKRSPKSKISNYNFYMVGPRYSADRTRTVFTYAKEENPNRGYGDWEIGDGELGHGVNWGMFNYNPYGRQGVGLDQNPNFRILNDWLKITGLGGIDVDSEDVMTKKEVEASGMLQYRNYPSEGYNSFGKKTAGGTGDKRWTWQGNTWVPAP